MPQVFLTSDQLSTAVKVLSIRLGHGNMGLSNSEMKKIEDLYNTFRFYYAGMNE